MSVIIGHPDNLQRTAIPAIPSCVTPIGTDQNGLQVVADVSYIVQSASATVTDANSTTTVIDSTAHGAQRGDVIQFTSGALATNNYWPVYSVTANTITLGNTLPSAPANGVAFTIFRPSILVTDTSGNMKVAVTPNASGAWTPVLFTAQTTTVQTVKSSAGALGGWYLWNPNTTVAYVQIFDTSGAVTLGTTTPKMSLGVPPGGAANMESADGISFANAIKIACTTTASGLTAPTTGLDVNFIFR